MFAFLDGETVPRGILSAPVTNRRTYIPLSKPHFHFHPLSYCCCCWSMDYACLPWTGVRRGLKESEMIPRGRVYGPCG
jgi:hypothetical protein